MPRVVLTDAQRKRQRKEAGDKALLRCLGHYKVDTGLGWDDLAESLHVSTPTLWRWRGNPGMIPLDKLRQMVAECRMTPEEWLSVGGFKP